VDRAFHRAMVSHSALPTLLASSAPPSLGYGTPVERSIHRGAHAQRCRKSHFFLYN
jgi:hypothetical protein